MIELKFDFKQFGCNEKAVKELIKEIVRVVNQQEGLICGQGFTGPQDKYEITLSASRGVYVRPGMRGIYGKRTFTVAPKGTYYRSVAYPSSPFFELWWEDGSADSFDCLGDKRTTSCGPEIGGLPVLGYEEDK